MNVNELRRQELSSAPTPVVGTGVAERANFTSRLLYVCIGVVTTIINA
jgi:hypothetical protein